MPRAKRRFAMARWGNLDQASRAQLTIEGLRNERSKMALSILAAIPYGPGGDFFETDFYDNLVLEDGEIELPFFTNPLGSQYLGARKHQGFTNLPAQPFSRGQAFSASHISQRYMMYNAAPLTDGVTNAVMAEFLENIRTCYFEMELSQKKQEGSFSCCMFMPTWMIPPAAGAIGVPQGIVQNESWRRLFVPFKVPQSTNWSVPLRQGSGLNWSTNVKGVFSIMTITRGLFLRKQ